VKEQEKKIKPPPANCTTRAASDPKLEHVQQLQMVIGPCLLFSNVPEHILIAGNTGQATTASTQGRKSLSCSTIRCYEHRPITTVWQLYGGAEGVSQPTHSIQLLCFASVPSIPGALKYLACTAENVLPQAYCLTCTAANVLPNMYCSIQQALFALKSQNVQAMLSHQDTHLILNPPCQAKLHTA
jgi:hypothetical protein